MSTPLQASPNDQPLRPSQARRPHKQTLWRRKSLDVRRADALQRAQELIWLADKSEYWQDPENKELLRELYRLADKVRKDAAPLGDESVRQVLKAMKYEYCQTLGDFLQQIYMTRRQLKAILELLINSGAVERRQIENVRGPRQWTYHLTRKPYKDWVL